RHKQTSKNEQNPWRQSEPEYSAPSMILGIKNHLRRSGFCDVVNFVTKIQGNAASHDEPNSQQPLENACALAAVCRAQTFSEIKRHDNAYKSGTETLQQSPRH